MKLNKILAAGLIAASSASSMAAIIVPATGNSELVLLLWDSTAKVSYVKDLGIQIDSFDPTASLSFVVNDTYFTSFLNIANAVTVDDFTFSVLGGDNLAAGGKRLFSTSNNPVTVLSGSQNTNSNNFIGDMTAKQNIGPSPKGDHSATLNGSSYAVEGEVAYVGALGQNLGNTNPWLSGNVIGTDSTFRSFTSANTSGTQATQVLFDGIWSFKNTNGVYTAEYNVAAIPEGDGIAMGLAGLGALGFVALRRRQSK